MCHQRACWPAAVELPPLVWKFVRIIWKRPLPRKFPDLTAIYRLILASPPTFIHQLLALGFDEMPNVRVLPPLLHKPEEFVVTRQVPNHMAGSLFGGAELWPFAHQPGPSGRRLGRSEHHWLGWVFSPSQQLSSFQQIKS